MTGDDVTDRLDLAGYVVLETGEPLAAYRERIVSSMRILALRLLEALQQSPHVIVAGRTSDAALFLAPLVHAFGWARDDWDRLAAGLEDHRPLARVRRSN